MGQVHPDRAVRHRLALLRHAREVSGNVAATDTARAKATPHGRDGHWRIRHDKVDKTGRDYQPLGRPPGPPKGSPQRGGRPGKTTPE